MTGPKMRPDTARAAPLHGEQPDDDDSEIGSTYASSSGAATSRPSTAESTEIAGVITPSPKNRQAPAMPTRPSTARALRADRDALRQRHEREDAAFARDCRPA